MAIATLVKKRAVEIVGIERERDKRGGIVVRVRDLRTGKEFQTLKSRLRATGGQDEIERAIRLMKMDERDASDVDLFKRGAEEWEEQAEFWDAKGDRELAENCRMKARQWREVISMFTRL